MQNVDISLDRLVNCPVPVQLQMGHGVNSGPVKAGGAWLGRILGVSGQFPLDGPGFRLDHMNGRNTLLHG